MNVALVGAGLQGRRRAAALQQANGDRLVIVADIEREAAERLAAEFGGAATDRWEEAVARDDVHALIVCTPPHLHAPIGITALKAGKHLICEKPMSRSPAEAKAVLAAAQESGAKLKCGLNHRHHPAVRQAKLWCEQGEIGEIVSIRCRHGIGGRPGYDREWRSRQQVSGGGQLVDQGLHALDLFRWFLGEFREAFGFVATSFWDIRPLEDNAFVLLRTAGGQIASLHTSWTEWKNLFSFEVFGKEGYVRVEGLGGSYGTERAVLGKRAPLEPFREQVIEYRGADVSWREEWREFVAAIKEGREPIGNGRDGLEALRLAHAVYRSAQTGCVVKLEDYG